MPGLLAKMHGKLEGLAGPVTLANGCATRARGVVGQEHRPG